MLEIIGFGGKLSIEVQHVQLEPLPDYGAMRWKVAVSAYGLTGESNRIGIWPTHYERFLSELTQLERERRGTAILTSTSLKELRLKFQPLDRLGHMMIEGQLGRYTYIGDRSFFQKLKFAFEFEPTLLPSLVSQFSAFKTWVE